VCAKFPYLRIVFSNEWKYPHLQDELRSMSILVLGNIHPHDTATEDIVVVAARSATGADMRQPIKEIS
jgi:hypothetical protein